MNYRSLSGMTSRWIVHKFGGTSVANAERYRAAAEIVVSSRGERQAAVVVSAMSGVHLRAAS